MSAVVIVIVIVIIVVVAVALGLRLRSRTANDGVDSFRRQIDALSPEARKPTVDQVKSAERPDDEDRADGDDSTS
jgi:Sec-independent protein translocase protein TatA